MIKHIKAELPDAFVIAGNGGTQSVVLKIKLAKILNDTKSILKGSVFGMKYGGSILVIAIGLIIALAINIDVQGIDLQLIGWILTALGALGLVITIIWDISASSRRNQARPTLD